MGTVAVTVFFSGCIPYSGPPLSDPWAKPTDPILIGNWYWQQSEKLGYIHIWSNWDGSALRLAMGNINVDGELELSQFTSRLPHLTPVCLFFNDQEPAKRWMRLVIQT